MNKRLILYACVAALGGLLFGFDTAVVNGALEFFREYLQLEADSFLEGWVVSSALLGCVVGLFNGGSSNGKGVGYIFGFYAVMTLTSHFFFRKFLVETKGKSLEELEKETLKQ